MTRSLFTRFLLLLTLFSPALASAQGRSTVPVASAPWAWLLGIALVLLLAIALWAWVRLSHPPRKLGP